VILVDANVLIYAVDADSRHHERCRVWLEGALSGHERVALSWSVVLAFLRVATRPGILRFPLTFARAAAYVDSWLEQPCVKLVHPGEGHWPLLRQLVGEAGTAGNLTTDAHLAALALEHNALVVSLDQDFRRFPSVRVQSPE
jgi:uncharacterized protein